MRPIPLLLGELVLQLVESKAKNAKNINKEYVPRTRCYKLDQLISLHLKHTIEEVEQKYDTSVDHYLDPITRILKVHDDLVAAKNELIKQTHVRHEKQI